MTFGGSVAAGLAGTSAGAAPVVGREVLAGAGAGGVGVMLTPSSMTPTISATKPRAATNPPTIRIGPKRDGAVVGRAGAGTAAYGWGATGRAAGSASLTVWPQ